MDDHFEEIDFLSGLAEYAEFAKAHWDLSAEELD